MEEKTYIRINGISKDHFEKSDEILKKLHAKTDSCIRMMFLTKKLHMYRLAEKYGQKGLECAVAGLNLCNANLDLLMTATKHCSFKK